MNSFLNFRTCESSWLRNGTAAMALVLSLCVCWSTASAQAKKIASVELPHAVQFAAVDRPGDVYLVLTNGAIQKISKDGVVLATTKYAHPPDLFDPRDGVLAFVYFRDQQKIEYLSPDLTVSDSQKIPAEFANHPWLCAPSKNEVWILDSIDLSLKKTAARIHAIEKDVAWQGPVVPIAHLRYLREYQNFLFLLDEKTGVNVINSMGKSIKTLGKPGLLAFNFLGEEFYFQEHGVVYFIDLYSSETRTAKLPYACEWALLTDERMFLINGKVLDIFEFKP